ncbi:hypothetical protein [Photobacterium leiognathi]|uniref:hypothetical protein n=1 Tax=Photobacterium leiognathi TaxID=553611 RepID=UPI002981E42A|nr:hypothetical protein [Photobacterium leiognathi]
MRLHLPSYSHPLFNYEQYDSLHVVMKGLPDLIYEPKLYYGNDPVEHSDFSSLIVDALLDRDDVVFLGDVYAFGKFSVVKRVIVELELKSCFTVGSLRSVINIDSSMIDSVTVLGEDRVLLKDLTFYQKQSLISLCMKKNK